MTNKASTKIKSTMNLNYFLTSNVCKLSNGIKINLCL